MNLFENDIGKSGTHVIIGTTEKLSTNGSQNRKYKLYTDF